MFRLFKRLPFVEAIISFVSRLGLAGYISASSTVLAATFWGVWGFIESNLPKWGGGLLVGAVFALVGLIANQAIEYLYF